MPTVPIPAHKVVTTFDAASRHERIEIKPPLIRFLPSRHHVWIRHLVAFFHRIGAPSQLVSARRAVCRLRYRALFPTITCRTVFGPFKRQSGRLTRSIRGMLTIPSPHTKVRIAIDDVPLETVQVGISSVRPRRQVT